MADELKTQFSVGATVYAIVLNALGQAWRTDTHVFENPASADWADYANALTEFTGTGIYMGSFPSAIAAAGDYPIIFRQQAGGSPAASDSSSGMGGGVVHWSGSAEIVFVNAPTASAIAAAIVADDVPINVTFVSPVSSSGEQISLVRGNDYFNEDGRALVWNFSAGELPNLTGGSISLQLQIVPGDGSVGSAGFTIAGVITEAGTGTQSAYFELPDATTSQLAIGNGAYYFAINATLADGHVETAVQGTVNVAHEP